MITRFTLDDTGRIDEIVADASVHLERLNQRDWMLMITSGDQRIHLNVKNVFLVDTANCQATPP